MKIKQQYKVLGLGLLLNVIGGTTYAQQAGVSDDFNSIFLTEAGKANSNKYIPTLNDHLANRRNALILLLNTPTQDLQPITLRAKTTAEQRSGVRRMKIRDFQIISDSGTDYAGYSLGPGSPESAVTVIASDLTDSYLNQAALKGIPLESLSIQITNRPDAAPTNRVGYPRNFLYTAYIESPASDEQLEELRIAAEKNSPIFNFIINPQKVTGDIDYTKTDQKVVIPEGGQPGLREYLKYKRIAYLHLQEEGKKRAAERAKNPNRVVSNNDEPRGPIVTVDPSTGVRRLQIRQFRLLHDNPTFLAGNDLGPTALEHQIGVLSSCITHIFLIQAAAQQVAIDSLEVSVEAKYDIRAGRKGFENIPSYPTDIHYTVHVKSPESKKRIEELRDVVDSVCPIYNLFKDDQTIEGRIVRGKKD